jgi:hypothetical protein
VPDSTRVAAQTLGDFQRLAIKPESHELMLGTNGARILGLDAEG